MINSPSFLSAAKRIFVPLKPFERCDVDDCCTCDRAHVTDRTSREREREREPWPRVLSPSSTVLLSLAPSGILIKNQLRIDTMVKDQSSCRAFRDFYFIFFPELPLGVNCAKKLFPYVL